MDFVAELALFEPILDRHRFNELEETSTRLKTTHAWLMGDCSTCRVACRNLSDLHGAAGRQEVDLLYDDRQSSAVVASVSRSCNGDLHSCIFTTNNFSICCRLWPNPRANRGRSPAQRLGLCPPGCEVRSYGPILAEAKALLLLLRLFESPAPPPPRVRASFFMWAKRSLGAMARHLPAAQTSKPLGF